MKMPKGYSSRLVSDHALVRYIERVMGIDADALRSLIVAGIEATVANTRSGEIRRDKENMKLVVRDGMVVTILPLK